MTMLIIWSLGVLALASMSRCLFFFFKGSRKDTFTSQDHLATNLLDYTQSVQYLLSFY